MAIRKSHAAAAAVFIVYFLFSLLFSPYYVTGDQRIYREYYDAVGELGFFDAYIVYFAVLNSHEPVFFLLTWLASAYVQKDAFMSLVNAAMVTCAFLYLRRVRARPIVMCILAVNFYLLVLMFAAERFKFGVVFFLVALLVTGPARGVFAAISMLSHFQMLILYAAIGCKYAANILSRLNGIAASWGQLMFRRVPLAGAGIVLFVPVAMLFLGLVLSKIEVFYDYSSSKGFAGLLRPMAFLLLSLIYAKRNRLEVIAFNLPIVVASFFLGSERLTIFSYMIFLYYGLAVRGGLNMGVIASSTYFGAKGLVFLADIYSYGRGFDLEEFE